MVMLAEFVFTDFGSAAWIAPAKFFGRGLIIISSGISLLFIVLSLSLNTSHVINYSLFAEDMQKVLGDSLFLNIEIHLLFPGVKNPLALHN
ncbi:hypothetical protein [Pseudoteredinibacter isoporae]|uniref:hypothetical protein n=1 Tax=Pseudoteredinibacter isoporae TaxID=570281 RepID=UPI001C87E71B|nr:hypothetical protein [Pseudoteredinibacter isoporae]